MILRAKYVMPNSRTIIENGAVAIQGSKIVDVGPYPTIREQRCTSPIHDLGEAVLIPGLVNAHTHLDLTGCRRFRSTGLPNLPIGYSKLLGKRTPSTVGAIYL